MALDALGLDDHRALDKRTRETASRMSTAAGCECYRRKWDRFGKPAAVRDLVLCAAPPTSAKRLSPPSELAVERMLCDAWAASQPRVTPRTGGRARSASLQGQENRPPPNHLRGTAAALLARTPSSSDELPPPSSPLTTNSSAACASSPVSISPACIFSRLDDADGAPGPTARAH